MKLAVNLDRKTLGIAAVVSTLLVGGAFFLLSDHSAFANSEDIEANCNMNGLGQGTCSFVNTGEKTGSDCVEITVTHILGFRHVGSTKVCSGRLKPQDVAERTFTISAVRRGCQDDITGKLDTLDIPRQDRWQVLCQVTLESVQNKRTE